MKKTAIIALACLSFAACSEKSNKDKIVGKWHGAYQENPQMDQMIEEQLKALDTVGQNTTPAQNLELYGTSNMDSFKAMQRQQVESFKAEQQQYLEKTIFDFRKDGTVVFNFGDNLDSATWTIDDKGTLTLDEKKGKGEAGEKVSMHIEYLTDTAMKLKFNENSFTGSVVFHPEKK